MAENITVCRNSPHAALNEAQKSMRDELQRKLDSGAYKMESRPCLCGAKDDEVISSTDRYGLDLRTVICKNCGMLRVDPRPDARSLKEFYSREYQDLYFVQGTEDLSGHFRAQYTNGVYIRDFIKGHLNINDLKGRSVLEVGCSAGGILLPFAEDGAVVQGYDYNEKYLAYGRGLDRRLDLKLGGIDEVKGIGGCFDVVIMNHVLEHLSDPASAIKTIAALLKKDGILYISVPSVKNAHYYLSPGKRFAGSLHLAHLYHFTRSTLISVMEGFEPLFVDEKVRGIFKVSPGNKPHISTGEYAAIKKYINWREHSASGALRRLIDVILYNHYYYTRLLKILYTIPILPKSWISGITY